ncbi:Uncharacterised protein [Serratia odorifera]|uniref:Uncharacterized protein n=1 Tax=Serratia odorifera TaxID=618 RepID=A0A3S4EMJ0_SEROD|nr:Uncharacterised protein [Serratia odorifera]VDZ66019.1 Uncharacterised protein [Serratia odorifera]
MGSCNDNDRQDRDSPVPKARDGNKVQVIFEARRVGTALVLRTTVNVNTAGAV